MRKLSWLAIAVMACAFLSAQARAQDTDAQDTDIVSVHIPDHYLIGQAPPGMVGFPLPPANGTTSATVQNATAQTPARRATETSAIEHQQDDSLPQNYTVVAPIFLGGDDGTTSYIRFFNGQTTTAYTNVTVVGDHSGHVYGTANVVAPVYASPQYSIQEILDAANVHGFVNGDDGYSLYLSDPENKGNNGFQHVIFNGNNNFFENASMCTYLNNEQYEAINRILINVHTSTLADFPAYIYIHNYYSQPVTYTVRIADARDGTVIGDIQLQQLAANSTYSVPFTFFEQALHWTPRANQEHANMIFSAPNGYYAIVGQMIYNQRFGSYVNMSHFCAINHYDTPTN